MLIKDFFENIICFENILHNFEPTKLYKIMESIRILTFLVLSILINQNVLACKSCGCSSSKESHTHSEKSITKEVIISESSVKWLANKVTGSHEGIVAISDAHLHFEDDLLSGGNITIDMNSINCTDLVGEPKEQLEGHLLSDDFFGTKYYPTAELEIIKAEKVSADIFKVSAIIEIKGVKQNINFNASIKNGVAKADLVIDRSKFNIRYGSGTFFENLGDKMIYDEFNLSVIIAYEK